LFCAAGCGCGVSAVLEERGDYCSCGFFIIDDQDSFLRHDFSIGGEFGLVIFGDFFWEEFEEVFVGFRAFFEGGRGKDGVFRRSICGVFAVISGHNAVVMVRFLVPEKFAHFEDIF
jgi:hypothetical protein